MALTEWQPDHHGKGVLVREERDGLNLGLRLWQTDSEGTPYHHGGLKTLGIDWDVVVCSFAITPDGQVLILGDGIIEGRSYEEVVVSLDARLSPEPFWTF